MDFDKKFVWSERWSAGDSIERSSILADFFSQAIGQDVVVLGPFLSDQGFDGMPKRCLIANAAGFDERK